MAKFKARIIYPDYLVTVPVLALLARDHNVLSNIRRASVEDGAGWIICELEGEAAALESGVAWMVNQGVQVESLSDVVES